MTAVIVVTDPYVIVEPRQALVGFLDRVDALDSLVFGVAVYVPAACFVAKLATKTQRSGEPKWQVEPYPCHEDPPTSWGGTTLFNENIKDPVCSLL